MKEIKEIKEITWIIHYIIDSGTEYTRNSHTYG